MFLKIKKILKHNINGQGTLEFGGCVITFMLLTLGMFDACKAGVVYMENNMILSETVSKAVSTSAWSGNTEAEINNEISNKIKDNFFCTTDNKTSNCSNTKNPVVISDIDIGAKANKNAGNALPAGSILCVKMKTSYEPLFKQILINKKMTFINSACSVMEYAGATGIKRIKD